MSASKKVLLIYTQQSPKYIDLIDHWLKDKYSNCDLHLFVQAKYVESLRDKHGDKLTLTTFTELKEFPETFPRRKSSPNVRQLTRKINDENFDRILIMGRKFPNILYLLWLYLDVPLETFDLDNGFSLITFHEFTKGVSRNLKNNYLSPLLNNFINLLFLPPNLVTYLLYLFVDSLPLRKNCGNLSMPVSSFFQFNAKIFRSGENDDPEEFQRVYRRYSTALLRKYPDFLLVGVEKSGSSTLTKYLQTHSRINLPQVRGTYYFSGNLYELGDAWYRSFFSMKARWNQTEESSKKLDFEWGVPYFNDPEVPKQIKLSLPEAQFVLVMRNPVDRAHSHYHSDGKRRLISKTNKNDDLEDKKADEITFRYALEHELDELPDLESITQKDLIRSLPRTFRIGLYYFYLKNWFDSFSRDKFLIIKSENLFHRPRKALGRVSNFLDINEFKNVNKLRANPGDYPQMDEETRQFLEKLYRPFNEKLYELIGRDLGW